MVDLLGLPTLASEHGAKIDQIIAILHVIMVILFIGWAVFFVYCLARFRKKKHPKANPEGLKTHASSYLEAAVALCEAVLLIGFSIPFWMAEVDAMPSPEANPFEVRVVAQQFAWNVHYPGPDGRFGRVDIDLVDDVENPLGIDRSDANAKDDVTSVGVLRLPVGRPVLIHLTSKDVVHSLSLPEFRIKQDAIPGMSVPVHFTPTLTTKAFQEITGDNARNFEIVCSQLCGLGHFRMSGLLFVRTDEEIQEWIESRAGR